MDDLEIKIAITYRIPRNNLTLNGLLRGLERDRDEIMRAVTERILSALEEKPKPTIRLVGLSSTATNRRPAFF